MTKSRRITPLALILIIIGAMVVGGLAVTMMTGSLTKSIQNTPTGCFEMDLEVPDGQELGPGDEMTINPVFYNKSNGPVYAFIKVDFDSSIYSFSLSGSDWKAVPGEDNVYAYVEGTGMKVLAQGEDATLTGMLTVIKEKNFTSVTANDMLVNVTGCGILTSISRSGVGEAWEDYQNGGKQ